MVPELAEERTEPDTCQPGAEGRGQGKKGWQGGGMAGLALLGLGQPPEPRHLEEGLIDGAHLPCDPVPGLGPRAD